MKEESSVSDVMSALGRTEKGKISQTIDNCMIVFNRDPILKGAIQKNELTNRVDITKKNIGWRRNGLSITDVDVYNIQYYIERMYGIKSEKAVKKAMNIAANENSYHPIKDFLEGLAWDGTSRIYTLLPKYLGVEDSEYTREIIKLLMLAAVHRIYDPGCKFEIMVCLVGGQGTGKSTFFRFLACNDDWFSDDLKRLDDENVYRKMQGHWIIEMSEMIATVNARSIEDIKAFISRQKETYKIPYEVHSEDRLRQCIFVGTSNSHDFLPLDRTGNRRFAPIQVNPEKIEKHILENEREAREYFKQAWAEVMEMYRENPNYELKLSVKSENFLKEWQQQFMPEDTKTGVVQAWLDNCSEKYVCSLMIFREALGHESGDPKSWEIREINAIMNEQITGWEAVRSTHRFPRYGIQRFWKRVEIADGFYQVSDDA
ncbi:MAG: virulence-associated protein E [Firmicutes bacterium]|nr:virulence-associated protein E [Bacillota bacterium]